MAPHRRLKREFLIPGHKLQAVTEARIRRVCAAHERRRLFEVQPDHVVLDGDLVNAVPFSSEVVERVRQLAWVVVRGNHEFYYLDYGTERAAQGSDNPSRWGQLHWLAENITVEQGAYLAMLPDERTLYLPGTRPICVAHGVPGRNRVGFYSEQPAESIAAEIGDIAQSTVISAHTHVQVDRHIYAGSSAIQDSYSDPHSSGGQRDGNGHQLARWHLLRQRLHPVLRRRHRRHPDRDTGTGIRLLRMERQQRLQ